MWLYFNKKGQLITSLKHGNTARAGTTDFEIFAVFKDIVLEDTVGYPNATIKLKKPDLDGSSYPFLIMQHKTATFNLVGSETSNNIGEFKVGEEYEGFYFNFADFNDDEDVEVLLDTPGLWQAIITLIAANNLFVQGVATFNVEEGTNSACEEAQVEYDLIIGQIERQIANLLPTRSPHYFRTYTTSELEAINFAEGNNFQVGEIIVDKNTKNVYQINALTTFDDGCLTLLGNIENPEASAKEYIDEKYNELTQLVSDANAGQFPIISDTTPEGEIVAKQLWIDISDENPEETLLTNLLNLSPQTLTFDSSNHTQTPFYILDDNDTMCFEETDNLTFEEEGDK